MIYDVYYNNKAALHNIHIEFLNWNFRFHTKYLHCSRVIDNNKSTRRIKEFEKIGVITFKGKPQDKDDMELIQLVKEQLPELFL